jgi:hypothetical protein
VCGRTARPTDEGRIVFPYDAVKIEFVLEAAQAEPKKKKARQLSPRAFP